MSDDYLYRKFREYIMEDDPLTPVMMYDFRDLHWWETIWQWVNQRLLGRDWEPRIVPFWNDTMRTTLETGWERE